MVFDRVVAGKLIQHTCLLSLLTALKAVIDDDGWNRGHVPTKTVESLEHGTPDNTDVSKRWGSDEARCRGASNQGRQAPCGHRHIQ